MSTKSEKPYDPNMTPTNDKIGRLIVYVATAFCMAVILSFAIKLFTAPSMVSWLGQVSLFVFVFIASGIAYLAVTDKLFGLSEEHPLADNPKNLIVNLCGILVADVSAAAVMFYCGYY
eukprot:TRINITY_DN11244_c0_g1_i1.p1 TRINITY_DN11244_c0_g1~~TRINITY_DN11244_c0_g1_i1.p1  ORF type:complete len:118 (-),score=12.93 TRINITY_DN11244_c0_g1_i1:70-423(-)